MSEKAVEKESKKESSFPVHFCLKCNIEGKIVFLYQVKVYKAPSQLFFTATLKDEDPAI